MTGCCKWYSVNTLLIQLYNDSSSILTKKNKGSFTSLVTAVIADVIVICNDTTNQFKVLDAFSVEQNTSGFSPIVTSVNWELGRSSPMVEFPQIAV